MRTKALITALLLGSTLAGVASADPIVRDHREQPAQNYYQSRAGFINKRASWMPQYTASTPAYGYQVDNDGDEVIPYQQGQDPDVEYVPRASWSLITQEAHLNGRGYASFDLGARAMTSLELQAQDTGRLLDIDRVRVVLKDGRVIDVRPDRTLDRVHSPNLRVDLGASARCGVERVTVYGEGGGGFRVLGA